MFSYNFLSTNALYFTGLYNCRIKHTPYLQINNVDLHISTKRIKICVSVLFEK